MSSDRIEHVVLGTGRLYFEPMEPHRVRPIAELSQAITDALSRDGSFTATVTGTDFTMLEQYVLSSLLHESRGGQPVPAGSLYLDLESGGGQIPGPLETIQRMMDNFHATAVVKNRQMSLYANGAIRDAMKRVEPPKIKQNGRSADYLRHDRTKRHDRRR